MCETGYVPRIRTVSVNRPRWGLLYGIVFVGLAALAVADVAAAPPARPEVDGVVAGAVFIGVVSWIRSNRAALDQQAWCECAADTLTIRVIRSRRPEPLRTIAPPAPDPVCVDPPEETLIRT